MGLQLALGLATPSVWLRATLLESVTVAVSLPRWLSVTVSLPGWLSLRACLLAWVSALVSHSRSRGRRFRLGQRPWCCSVPQAARCKDPPALSRLWQLPSHSEARDPPP